MLKFFLTERFNNLPDLVFLAQEPNMGKGYTIATLTSTDTHLPHEVVTDPKEADFILVPHYVKECSEETKKHIANVVLLARQHNKTACVFLSGDYADKVWFPDIVIFKATQYRHQKRINEIIMPPVSEDLARIFGFEKQSKSEVLSIGFCGWAQASLTKKIFLIIRFHVSYLLDFIFRTHYAVKTKGIYFRSRVMNIFNNEKVTKNNFIVRKSFSGRLDSVEIDPKKARTDFVDNIKENNFSLCVKGDGNHSVRFFETLSLARIPFLIDTDVVLPLEKTINYKSFCVALSYKEMSKAPKFLTSFYDSVTDESFQVMQQAARQTYERYLSLPAFLSHVFGRLKAGYTGDTL